MEREEQFPYLSDHAIQEGNGLLNISDNFIESYSEIFQNRLNYSLELKIKKE
jgi:hypothetical protein